jgi:hypothetical protein
MLPFVEVNQIGSSALMEHARLRARFMVTQESTCVRWDAFRRRRWESLSTGSTKSKALRNDLIGKSQRPSNAKAENM